MNQRILSRLRSHSLLSAIIVFLFAGSWILLWVSAVEQEIMGGKIIPFAPAVTAVSVFLLGFLVSFIIKHL